MTESTGTDTNDDEGQVSEVGKLDPAEAETPIQPDQATAGSPDDDVQEGTAGPNARPHDDEPRGAEDDSR